MTSSGTSRPIAPLEYTLIRTVAVGSSTNPSGLEEDRSGFTNAPVAAEIAVASALCPTGKLRPCDLRADFGQLVRAALERSELGVAVRALGTAVELDRSSGSEPARTIPRALLIYSRRKAEDLLEALNHLARQAEVPRSRVLAQALQLYLPPN